jgi:hypothetical protein
MRRALAFALVISSALTAACARDLLDTDPFAEPDLSGSVRIPLSASAEDGTLYLLRDATLEISGSAMLTLDTPSAEQVAQPERALSTPLPPGAYTLFLRPGYRVIEIAPNGAQRTIEVALSGTNPQRFQLREVEDATLQLSFAHGEHELVFGAAPPVRITRR